ncbi:unnamed protein product [Heterobilharzia americana]|nr:unnamed protein product [Heterobilharzia americana]
MLNENTQMMIKNDNSMSKLESTCDHNSIRPCHCSFTLQTFANMGTELNSGSLHSDTMITHPVSESANSGVCLISSNPLRSSEIPQPLSPYHHSVHQTFNLPSNSIQELHISAVSQSVFPGQIPAVIPAAVNSSNLSLSPLLFHPPGPYILPNPSSANLSPAHLQTVNPQISNIPLNSEYKNLSPSGILEATLHNSVPLVTGPIDGSAANPIKPVSDSQSVGTNKGTNENGNYYVMVHVDAGETFSVRVGDQIQHIPGPATVRMVSNSGPPLPMPMQVPPGHLVQQIVDEEGILTHVILSPYPTPPLPMVATGVPMSISQTNDVSTAGANLILNPNQHLQPHHHHHRHLHPLLTSPGIPSNEGLIHINPYASQHPQPIPGHSIHPFPPPPFIHPHFPHFHQQFHVHSAHPHVCGIADGDSNVSTKYPITSEIIDDKTHCDTSICRSTYLVNEFSDSPYANPYSKEI